jgi:ribosome-associated heat shock protein Hsp15
MGDRENVRIDKFLWAVRLFKTRSIAAEACKKGRVQINGIAVKSSRTVKEGDTIDVKTPPITRTYKVLAVAEKRMGAKLVPDFIKDITPEDQIEILEMTRLAYSQGRRKGLGRPTKKDRRDIERLFNED